MLKRMLILALALMLACLPALAETTEPQPLEQGVTLTVDLDGDGTEESVLWEMAAGQYEDVLMVTVTGASGARTTYPTDILWGGVVYVVDLNGDGAMEILLSGDVMSDDYFTWCLQYQNGRLVEVLFPDCGRGEVSGAYYKQGYGLITRVGKYSIELTGSQDVLGTWMASRRVSLEYPGRFEFCDNFVWERSFNDESDEDMWEYSALTVSAPIHYYGEHGCEDGILNPGEKIYVYSTDKSVAHFVTPEDVLGLLLITPNHDRGWGWLVDGIPEDECFNNLLYAD